MLIGEEEHPPPPLERPFQHGPGVGRRADDPALPAAKGLEAGRRVHVGDRHDVGDVEHFGQLLPAVLDLFDGGHVGHRTAGLHVGQDDRHPLAAAAHDLLGTIGQDVGRFGHEVYAAEGNRPALFFGRGQGGQLIAVAAEVGQGDHLVLLVMVPQDQEPPAHAGADLADPFAEDIAGQFLIRLQLAGRSGRVEEGRHGDSSGAVKTISFYPMASGKVRPLWSAARAPHNMVVAVFNDHGPPQSFSARNRRSPENGDKSPRSKLKTARVAGLPARARNASNPANS